MSKRLKHGEADPVFKAQQEPRRDDRLKKLRPDAERVRAVGGDDVVAPFN